MDTIDKLIAARAEVEKGWCRYHLVNGGNVCAIGALYRAAGADFAMPSPDDLETVKALRRSLQAALGTGQLVPAFNDHPSTTKADVIQLFDRAIAAEAVKVTADPSHVHAVQG
jgi:hypothetical protein